MKHRSIQTRLASLLFALLGLAAVRPAGAQGYTIINLGTLPGDDASIALGVNASGQVTGGSLTASGIPRAFLYSGGVMTNLGTLSGDLASAGIGINAAGTVAGVSVNILGTPHAALFSGGSVTNLNTEGYAIGINSAGQAVGFNESTDRAILFSGGTVTDLGTLGGNFSIALGINSAARVVGGADNNSGQTRPFLHDGTSMIDLGTLGGNEGYAYSINDAGQIVGVAETGSAQHAFLYDGVMTDLGTLPGLANSVAYSINAYGQAVGRATNGSALDVDLPPFPDPSTAFLYSGGALYDLHTLIPANSGWTLLAAMGIGDGGHITGFGLINGQTRAFLMTPTFKLKALGLSPATVAGCLTAKGKVTLNVPAPVNLVVLLTNTNPSATVPPRVTILKGKTSATFAIPTEAVSAIQTGTVTASLNGLTLKKTLKVRPIGVKTITLTPNPVVGGNDVAGKVTLECPAAPGDIVVTLSSTNPEVASPTVTSLTIPAGEKTGTFTVTTADVNVFSTATIKAKANGVTRSKKLKVNP